MRIGRLVLVVATLVTILLFPLLARDALKSFQSPNAYASAGPIDAAGRVYQNGNNNDNGGNNGDDDDDDDNDNEGNDESDNEGEDNGNETECFSSLNDNADEVPCDFDDNGNFDGANDNVHTPPAPAPAPATGTGAIPSSRRCFGVGESGTVHLVLEGGSVNVQVVSAGTFSQQTWIELDDVEDLNTVPAPPAGASLLGRMVWRVNAGANCDGGGVAALPGAVNLGIPYNIAADKSKLQIVFLRNNAWVEVPTVPDPNPNNPYISSTINETGTYAVIRKP
jgi:hypothetical protein